MVNEPEEERPAWLRRMENGAAGEVRTKSFLMDRFWILERSVDVDGADLIIQRRLTSTNLLDRNPPRLGVVQVKYFESEKTTQYVHKEYVVDSDGNPRSEFFLFLHSGKEDKTKEFFLSAHDLLSDFKVTDGKHSKPNCFVISGKDSISSEKYRVRSREIVLDRIERALAVADFKRNRGFLSWAIPNIENRIEEISPMYSEPLQNWYGNIPKCFGELKKHATTFSYDVESLWEKLKEIVETDDPDKALIIALDIDSEFGNSLRIPDELYNEDLHTVVKEHKKRYEDLKHDGLLDAYLKLQSQLVEFIQSDLGMQMPISRDEAYFVNIEYDNQDLSVRKIFSSTERVAGKFTKLDDDHWHWQDAPSTHGIYSEELEKICAYVLAGRFAYEPRKKDKDYEKWPWSRKLKWVALSVAQDVMYRIYFAIYEE